ncbi:MAG: hypothetical protein AUF67_09505 [Acidobacteria bacterium 13_1_20CM_58_21]|nr:MAG: hypothetical protein AUF67_09505 [Acidobacteria bacterium 13_1_20CM_58_21]
MILSLASGAKPVSWERTKNLFKNFQAENFVPSSGTLFRTFGKVKRKWLFGNSRGSFGLTSYGFHNIISELSRAATRVNGRSAAFQELRAGAGTTRSFSVKEGAHVGHKESILDGRVCCFARIFRTRGLYAYAAQSAGTVTTASGAECVSNRNRRDRRPDQAGGRGRKSWTQAHTKSLAKRSSGSSVRELCSSRS